MIKSQHYIPAVRKNALDTSQVRELIIDGVSDGEAIGTVLRRLKVKYNQHQQWLRTIADYRAAYSEAQEAGIEASLGRLANILDEQPNPQAAKVASDNLRWILSKADPARFGDRLDVRQTTVDLTGAFARALERAQSTYVRPSEAIEHETPVFPPLPAPVAPDMQSHTTPVKPPPYASDVHLATLATAKGPHDERAAEHANAEAGGGGGGPPDAGAARRPTSPS